MIMRCNTCITENELQGNNYSRNIKLEYFTAFLSIAIYYKHKVANSIIIIPD